MKSNNQSVRQIRFVAVLLALLLTNLVCTSAQTAEPRLTAGQWQADLDFMAEAMTRQHPNLFRRTSKEDFVAAVKQFRDRIPSLNEDQILVGLMKIVALVKDGHTGVFPRNHFRTGFYPIRFYLYQDGLFVRQGASEYAEAVGGRVIKIGNVSADEALKRISQLPAADNPMGVMENGPILLSIPELLSGLGINEDKLNLSLIVDVGGKEKTIKVKPSATLADILQPPPSWVDSRPADRKELPQYLKDPGNLYWFEYVANQKLLYVQQNAVQNKPDEEIGAFINESSTLSRVTQWKNSFWI